MIIDFRNVHKCLCILKILYYSFKLILQQDGYTQEFGNIRQRDIKVFLDLRKIDVSDIV